MKPDSPALAAGLQPQDIIITFEGQDWTVFDLLHPEHEVMHAKVRDRITKTTQLENLYMIVYRPAAGEKDEARGRIVKLGPMPPGKKSRIIASVPFQMFRR